MDLPLHHGPFRIERRSIFFLLWTIGATLTFHIGHVKTPRFSERSKKVTVYAMECPVQWIVPHSDSSPGFNKREREPLLRKFPNTEYTPQEKPPDLQKKKTDGLTRLQSKREKKGAAQQIHGITRNCKTSHIQGPRYNQPSSSSPQEPPPPLVDNPGTNFEIISHPTDRPVPLSLLYNSSLRSSQVKDNPSP